MKKLFDFFVDGQTPLNLTGSLQWVFYLNYNIIKFTINFVGIFSRGLQKKKYQSLSKTIKIIATHSKRDKIRRGRSKSKVEVNVDYY